MKLRDIYSSAEGPVFSFEFFPPKTPKGEENLLAEAAILKGLNPSFFSMTYGAGGSTRDKTIDLGERIRTATGIETVCHVTCVGQSRDEVRGVLSEISGRGMKNIMALRGDPPRGQTDWRPHPEGFRYASELMDAAREIADFSIAVAGFPEKHPDSPDRESDLKYLKLKIDHGADAVVTQFFFDNDDFFRWRDDLVAAGVNIPLVPGVIPILSAAQISRFAELSGARIPGNLQKLLEAAGGDEAAAARAGADYAAAQIRGLLDGGAPGVHIYCLNKSASSVGIFRQLAS